MTLLKFSYGFMVGVAAGIYIAQNYNNVPDVRSFAHTTWDKVRVVLASQPCCRCTTLFPHGPQFVQVVRMEQQNRKP